MDAAELTQCGLVTLRSALTRPILDPLGAAHQLGSRQQVLHHPHELVAVLLVLQVGAVHQVDDVDAEVLLGGPDRFAKAVKHLLICS